MCKIFPIKTLLESRVFLLKYCFIHVLFHCFACQVLWFGKHCSDWLGWGTRVTFLLLSQTLLQSCSTRKTKTHNHFKDNLNDRVKSTYLSLQSDNYWQLIKANISNIFWPYFRPNQHIVNMQGLLILILYFAEWTLCVLLTGLGWSFLLALTFSSW